ncbi:MAG TPA: TonB-dependent receptor [Tenuifilaceae bacterium]|nr:TonB-dependent receptor [Tenuifilaceae bacterium]
MKRLCVFLALLAFVGINILQAQTVQVTGTVTSAEDGMPIPGVSVMVKGTTIGTSTDIDGKYALSVPQTATVLVYSFVGMRTQEIEIGGRTTINIVLESDTQEIEEVMVVAYGTAKKSSFTGSATTISAEKIEKIQVSTVSKALEGISPGVQVVSSSGQPGEEATIRIRGIGSINASAAPLYVVDGVPYGGNISSINPNDIESVSFLKDAAANSLYGSRAANGVIMITTKKGAKGTSQVRFESRVGVNSRGVPEYDLITDPGQYYELSWEALRNQNQYAGAGMDADVAGALASRNLIQALGNYNNYNVHDTTVVLPNGKLNPAAKLLYNDKWHDEMFNNSVRQEYQLSISGGTEKSSHYISFGYLNDKGYVVRSNYERLSGRTNLDYQVYDWLKVGSNIGYTRDAQNFPTSSGSAYVNSFMFTRNIPVIYPVYYRNIVGDYVLDAKGNNRYDFGQDFILDENGEKIQIGVDGDGNPVYRQYSRKYGSNVNPVATTDLDIRENLYETVSLRPYVEIRFLNDFKFVTNLSVDSRNYIGTSYQNPLYGDAATAQGRSNKYQTAYLVSTFNQLLTWNKSFDIHSVEILVGHESFMTKNDYLYGRKEKFFIPDIPELSNAAIISTTTSYRTETRQESYLSRAMYNYDNKYFLSASFRRDGSSRFHPDHRWGNFWSVGGAWLMHKESFLQDISFINELKFKTSYGTNGNNGLLDQSGYPVYFPYQDLFVVTNVDGEIALQQTYKGNKEITWEKSKSFNIGFEGMFFKALTFEIEYFHKYTFDLLFNQPLPPSSGFTYFPNNIGNMVNRGIEFLVGYDIFKTKDFSWNVTVNATHYKNEITSLPDYINAAGGAPVGTKRLVEGGGIYDFYIETYRGVDEETGVALFMTESRLKQSNGDIDTDETGNLPLRYKGSAIPDLYGGISSTLNYKGIDFSFGFSYQVGGLVYDGVYAGLMGGLSELGGSNLHVDALDRWTPQNTKTNVPLLRAGIQSASQRSDRFLIDASYFNIRNISLGYTIPKKAFGANVPIASMRIYMVADNVYLWSQRKGFDPRQSITGTTDNNYSPIRTISGGLSLTF